MHFIVNRNNVNNYMLANADAYILQSGYLASHRLRKLNLFSQM